MGLPVHTTVEKPSTSETRDANVQASSFSGEQSTANSNSGAGGTRQPKGEAELAAEKLYEERIEDEYAKREGGA